MATVTQSRTARLKDEALRRLDRREGKSATFYHVDTPVISPGAGGGTVTPNKTAVANIKVRSKGISVSERVALSQSLDQFDVRFGMRKAYVAEVKSGDEIVLTSTGFRYRISLSPGLDTIEVDWDLFAVKV